MTEVLRLGVIGAGLAVRTIHLPVLTEIRDRVEVVSVVSRSRDSAELAADLFREAGHDRASVAPHVDALLAAGPDAVLVAVPIHLAAGLVARALRAGKHVLAEKPLAETAEEAMALVRAAGERGLVLAVGENQRFRPDFRSVRRFVEGGTIGALRLFFLSDLHHVDPENAHAATAWRRAGEHAGGYLVDNGVHVMARVREMVPRPVMRLTAEMTAVHPEYLGGQPDTLLVNLSYGGGVIGHVALGYGCHEKLDARRPRLHGDKGTIALLSETIELWDSGGVRVLAERDRRPGYREEWDHFLGCISGTESGRPLATESVVDLALVTGAIASARQGRPLDFAVYLRDLGISLGSDGAVAEATATQRGGGTRR